MEVTAFAMYVTVMYLTMTIASPFAGKLLQTMDIRILLSASAALVGCAFLLMSFSNTIVLFYVAAVMLGLGEITILWLAIPTLINRWFVERAGFFIGLCMAFTGIGGAIWSAVFTALTPRASTSTRFTSSGASSRSSRVCPSRCSACATLPRTAAGPLRRLHAEGASGAEVAAKPAGLSAGFVMKTPMFYAILRLRRPHQHRHPHRHAVPHLHQVAHRRGLRRGRGRRRHDLGHDGGPGHLQGGAGRGGRQERQGRPHLRLRRWRCGHPAVLVRHLLRVRDVRGRLHLRRLLRHRVVLVPVICRQSFGTREYSVIYSRVSTVFNLIAAFAAMIWAWLGSSFGFTVEFIVALAMLVVILLLGLYIFKLLPATRRTGRPNSRVPHIAGGLKGISGECRLPAFRTYRKSL